MTDKNIILTNIEFKNNTYFINIEQTKDPNLSCPKCGGLKLTNNFFYTRSIKYSPINGFPSIILFKQIRFKCKYCNKTFNQQTTLISKGCNISTIVKDTILEEFSYKQSFKDVSRRTNVSQTTISNEFKKNIHNYRCSLTRIICIDEFKASTIAGKYALIIGDPESGEILDILPSRLQDYIYYYFNTIDKSERLSVEYVVTDLFESYRTICNNLFWNIIHIADRFHWIRLNTETFNKTRISIMNNILKSKTKNNDKLRYAAIIKKYYKLLIANNYSKESWFFDQQVYKNAYVFTYYQSVIEYCVNSDKELEEVYLLLQELYKIAKLSHLKLLEKIY